ncbi:hypothetical protein GCM10009663_57280 [Kitasatospora arboriphila]|uniref:Uncharacterized protein n=1 Tax=Kitasatospora arboriphila TaxID=258052 RepID=A0ABP4EJB1_9ACTN
MTNFLLQAAAETLGALAAAGALALGAWTARKAQSARRARALRCQLARTAPAPEAPPLDVATEDAR